MILELAAHLGRMDNSLDAVVRQVLLVADAAEHEQLGRMDAARRDIARARTAPQRELGAARARRPGRSAPRPPVRA